MLVHLGLDTVALKGEGFTAHVSQGDDVTAGQVVITYDVPAIVAKGLNPDCARRGHGRARGGQRRRRRSGPARAPTSPRVHDLFTANK